MTYLTCRNEHIWSLTNVFTIDWKLFIWLPFFILLIKYNSNFWEAMPLTFWWIFDNWAFGFSIIHFNTYLLHLFLVKLVFEVRLFQLFVFLEIDIWRALLKKKKIECEEIYKRMSMHVSRSNKTIDQSFMTSLKIYLQQINVDF